jgi:hypothetical protein
MPIAVVHCIAYHSAGMILVNGKIGVIAQSGLSIKDIPIKPVANWQVGLDIIIKRANSKMKVE